MSSFLINPVFLVAIGGAIGSVARYKTVLWTTQQLASAVFPWGTFTVNVLGCCMIGVMAGVSERFDLISAEARLLLFTGLMGGFTTFSAFGLETVQLMRKGELLIASSYVLGSVAAGLLALWVGSMVTQLFAK